MAELADFIATQKSRIIGRWKERVVERLAIDLEHSELIDHLPDFVDDVVLALRDPEGSWPSTESANLSVSSTRTSWPRCCAASRMRRVL